MLVLKAPEMDRTMYLNSDFPHMAHRPRYRSSNRSSRACKSCPMLMSKLGMCYDTRVYPADSRAGDGILVDVWAFCIFIDSVSQCPRVGCGGASALFNPPPRVAHIRGRHAGWNHRKSGAEVGEPRRATLEREG
jgi:hypothetical protein